MDFPGVLLLALGLFAKFSGEDFLHPLLSNSLVIELLLASGGAIILVSSFRLFRLLRDKARLQQSSR
ncbi:hypothetical protein P2G88_11095 [Aliiglaciecola sp. CAU 1673]|uniref:hypothetical protein n=1 Tax=Aliiglaciecola sp. CAU 1673 TaxID=3032595 RepID=UPI0023DAEE88|nr:hypothetical protein [Aliiglaciecola sp. CAU 1673]MDF2178793.1 hypothetical protein [Aliiglaciecola sp. CAU 1673]